MNGIIILNKPKGLSSNTACRKVGKMLQEKKVGHLGTLDPMAEGVLPVTLGKCTKLFDFYLQKEKEYLADFTFGYETDTLDAEGVVVKKDYSIPNIEDIESKLGQFLGQQMQMPPKFSAKKVNGKRAYDLARKNEVFQLAPKSVIIYEFSLVGQIDVSTFRFKIACSSGTYIRSICRDLGYALKTCATMTKLVRTKCAKFKIENSTKLEECESSKLLTLDDIFAEYDKIELDKNQFFRFFNTSKVELKIEDGYYCLKCNEEIISFGYVEKGLYISRIRFI